MAGTRFVLDASVAVAWGLADEADTYPEEVLDALAEGEAVVPPLWFLEVSNALLVAERRKRLKWAEVRQFLALLQALPITVDPETPARIFGEVVALAREQGLSVYDATYLDLAMRSGLPLATMDCALSTAADRVGVAIFSPR